MTVSPNSWRAAAPLLCLLGGVAIPASAAELEKIVVNPVRATVAVGAARSFTATAHYTDRTTRNVTQQVRWTTSDPEVATAPNAKGKRGRVEAIAPGTVQIGAVDPRSGVASSTSSADATLVVIGALERISLAPERVAGRVGDTKNLTATGHYAGGGTRNLTQTVRYASSDPRVAAASNTAGKRSRIEIVGPGTATISATDPETGISSTATFTVLGALEHLSIAPAAATRRIGQAQSFTVTGHYAGGTTRNLTQAVRYESSDARVAAAPNTEGKRSRVDAVGVGTATISARDPETGIASDAATLVVTLTAAPAQSPGGTPAEEER